MSKLNVPVGPEDHAQGDAHAGCTLVEYGDYECPHCGRAYPIMSNVCNSISRKTPAFVSLRNFPLSQIHPYAESAAETAEFAGAGEKFWEMHDLLFENQDRLGARFSRSWLRN